jgi:hypothetical protein
VTADGPVRMKADMWIGDGGTNTAVAAVRPAAGGRKT